VAGTRAGWLAVGCLGLTAGAGAQAPAPPCDVFVDALDAIPHVTLARADGRFESVWDGETYAGCQVDFQTTDVLLAGASVPLFEAAPGSGLFAAGWRDDPMVVADGPGSGVSAIQRESTQCVIAWSQPAEVDDAGGIVQSDTFTMRVQCRNRAPAP